MKKETIIRAGRDPGFRESLTSEERAALPGCPLDHLWSEARIWPALRRLVPHEHADLRLGTSPA